MTYRLFFPSWGFGAAWGVAKACLVVRLSEGPHCLITGSVLLGTVAQLSRVAGTTWGKKITRSPSLALARAPEAFWELGFLLFLSTGPLGAIDNKLGPLVFFFFPCQKSPERRWLLLSIIGIPAGLYVYF